MTNRWLTCSLSFCQFNDKLSLVTTVNVALVILLLTLVWNPIKSFSSNFLTIVLFEISPIFCVSRLTYWQWRYACQFIYLWKYTGCMTLKFLFTWKPTTKGLPNSYLVKIKINKLFKKYAQKNPQELFLIKNKLCPRYFLI